MSNLNKSIGLLQRSQTWVLRRLILPAGDFTFGQRMMGRLSFLEEAQWWNPKRVADYRNTALRSLIQTAYREVPFYRNLMDSEGLNPDDVLSPADLRKIPIVTKEMLRSGYPHLTTRDTGMKTYESCSSGSTGVNFCVKEDAETAGWYRSSFLLGLEWAGWKIGEPHLQTGMTPNRSIDKRLKDKLLRCTYVPAYDLTDSSLDRTLEILDRKAIEHLWGYPGSLFLLAQRAREKGWNRPLRSIVTWGDNLFPHYRRELEAVFGTRIFDTYGCGEGVHIAAQCGASNSYHLHDLDVIVECVDGQGGAVPAGQPGHLLLTRLHAGPMPLIRYQIGDVGIMEDRQCECGRGFAMMRSIQGRDTDIVVTPSGNRLIVHFFTGILEHFKEIKTFQIIQDQPGSIRLRVVPAAEFNRNTVASVIAKLHESGAADLRVDVELVNSLPASPSGKRRFVISNIAKPRFDERSPNGTGNRSKNIPLQQESLSAHPSVVN